MHISGNNNILSEETLNALVSIMEAYGVPKDVMKNLFSLIIAEKSLSANQEHGRIAHELDHACMVLWGMSVDFARIKDADDVNNNLVECTRSNIEDIKSELTKLALNSWF